MQVDPIKPMLKAPGTKRLKRRCVETPSNFTFKFNVRRCNEVAAEGSGLKLDLHYYLTQQAGAYTRSRFRSN